MDKYYIYIHSDPHTKEIVYIGKGCNGRAWDVTRSRTANKDHQNWRVRLIELGNIPTDWVTIIHRNLSEKEAFKIECTWMHENGRPKFNKTGGEKNHQSKISDDQAREIYKLTKISDLYHKDIAKQYGISRSAVSMIATKKQWKAATSCLK